MLILFGAHPFLELEKKALLMLPRDVQVTPVYGINEREIKTEICCVEDDFDDVTHCGKVVEGVVR